MKNKKTLLYDDACPLCTWYSGAFVSTGLLDKDGREAFSTASPELLACIDRNRGVNEIPLIDNETNEVIYGIDSLIYIIGQRCPFVRAFGKYDAVKWGLKKFYNFISFNRKVIVARPTAPGTIDCTPRFSIFYRVLFMAIFLCFNTLMLFPIHENLLAKIPLISISLQDFHLAHAGIVGVNCLLATKLAKREAIEYLGQVNMLALVTILLLIPLMLANTCFTGLEIVNYCYLVTLTLFIIKEYFRRMKYAGLTLVHADIMVINLVSIVAFIASLYIL